MTQVDLGTVNGEEVGGRSLDVRAIGEGDWGRRGAQRDRERDAIDILDGVERDAEGRGAGERLDAELDQVRGVVGVHRVRWIGDRAVGRREEVEGWIGRRARIVRVSVEPPRTVIVIEEILVEVLAVAIRAGARD